MDLNLIISDPANQDLERIADYLGENYGLNRSERFISEITERMKYIAQFPYIGRSRDNLLPNSRSLSYLQYLIFYQVNETFTIVSDDDAHLEAFSEYMP